VAISFFQYIGKRAHSSTNNNIRTKTKHQPLCDPPIRPGQSVQTKRMRRPSGSAHPMAIDIQGLANSLQPVLGLTGQVAGSIPAARTFPP